MNTLSFLPAVLLAVPLFAVWRIRQTENRELCAFGLNFNLSIIMILTNSYMTGSTPLYVLEGNLRLAEAV
jgi:hypothetical protein